MMFVRDPFDLAPAAQRPTRGAWILLASGLLFAVICAVVFQRGVHAAQQARRTAAAQDEARRLQQQRDAAARARASDPAAVEKLRALRQLQRNLRMSWSGLFDALEAAGKKVDGRVSITSLAPGHSEADAAQVSLVGAALNNDVLLDYVQALQDQPQMKDVVMASHEPAQAGGTAVTRFHISLVWQPAAGSTK